MLILFPNQLFPPEVLKRYIPRETWSRPAVMFYEHPLFYGKRPGSGAVRAMKLNRVRLAYMVMAHRRYIQMLKTAFPGIQLHYVPYREAASVPAGLKPTAYIDPCDLVLEAWLQKKYPGIQRHDSPSFLLTRAQLDAAPGSTGPRAPPRLTHAPFYEYVKNTRGDLKALKHFAGAKNLDRENREPYRASMPMPPAAATTHYSTEAEWEVARKWIEDHGFSRNPGPLMDWATWVREYAVFLPVETGHAREWLKGFLRDRFRYFGPYEDTVVFENPLLFHSGLSTFLNNGLLTPDEVLEGAAGAAAAGKAKVPDASYEGFVRQIAGWREYARLYYHRVPASVYKKNVFGLRSSALSAAWYKGTTGLDPLDKTIRWAMNYGYINHIQRLMIMSNAMTLMEIGPDAVYRWMYEFSLDSYEWVMVFNVYSMGTWADAGVAMRKPYISSANYVRTMSNAVRSGPMASWIETWNKNYSAFMKRHQEVLKHTQAWRPKAIES